MRRKLIVLFLVWVILIASFYLPKKRYSAFENRFLETFSAPEINDVVSLEWMSDFENALCDQFNFRNISITIKTYVDQLLGRKDNGRVYFAKENYLMEIEETENLFLDKNIHTLNSLADYTNTPIDFIPVYTSLCALQDLAPRHVQSQQLSIMEYLKNNLENINIYDSYHVVSNMNDYYYKTDHHWTMLGAKAVYEFYSGKSLLEDLKMIKEDFLGTLYYQAPRLNCVTDTIYTLETNDITAKYNDGTILNQYYVDQHLNTNDAYRYYLGGNYERIDIETSTKNGKSLLLIKDSYANCFVPFLDKDYQYITILDMRYGNTNLYQVMDEEYDRCLFVYEINQFCNDEYLSRGLTND